MIALRPLRPEKKNPAEAGLGSGDRRIPDCLRADGESSGSPSSSFHIAGRWAVIVVTFLRNSARRADGIWRPCAQALESVAAKGDPCCRTSSAGS